MSHAISTECDANGVLTLTLDDKSRSMNVLSSEVIDELKSAIEGAAADAQIKSILIRSGKTSFVAGADLKELLATFATKPTPAEGVRLSQRLSQVFRNAGQTGCRGDQWGCARGWVRVVPRLPLPGARSRSESGCWLA